MSRPTTEECRDWLEYVAVNVGHDEAHGESLRRVERHDDLVRLLGDYRRCFPATPQLEAETDAMLDEEEGR